MKDTETFDYIIIGAGSAGGVLARRLSEDGAARVLVLEAGPMDRSPLLHMPSALAYPLQGKRYNWAFSSEPEPYMGGRRIAQPRGRVLGGSSSINGMVYVRGNPLDWDGWAREPGMEHWAYPHVLPYFIRAETWDSGRSDYRGTDGPLHTSRRNAPHLLDDVFIEAAGQAGLPHTEDTNGYCQEGIGYLDMTVHGGRRWSTADAYLRPACARGNLDLRTGARVQRIVFQGDRAVAVDYACRSRVRRCRAEREVLLCAGAINSPQLLLLSGIGDADHLRGLRIPVIADRREVGANLQDHLEVYVQYACTRPITLYNALSPLGKVRVGLRWLMSRSGWGASNHFEAGGFVRSGEDVAYPDIQYHFLPLAISYDGTRPAEGHGFQAHVGPMLPTSRGAVWLRSADPYEPPAMRFNYLQTEADRRVMRAAVRLTREIFGQRAFDHYRGRELAPGAGVTTDAELDAFAQRLGESAYHGCGTCRMGGDDHAVVDPQARVRGVEGLRVVDASIMPRIINANLNASVIMLAERIADHIREQQPLPPSTLPYYRNPVR